MPPQGKRRTEDPFCCFRGTRQAFRCSLYRPSRFRTDPSLRGRPYQGRPSPPFRMTKIVDGSKEIDSVCLVARNPFAAAGPMGAGFYRRSGRKWFGLRLLILFYGSPRILWEAGPSDQVKQKPRPDQIFPMIQAGAFVSVRFNHFALSLCQLFSRSPGFPSSACRRKRMARRIL